MTVTVTVPVSAGLVWTTPVPLSCCSTTHVTVAVPAVAPEAQDRYASAVPAKSWLPGALFAARKDRSLELSVSEVVVTDVPLNGPLDAVPSRQLLVVNTTSAPSRRLPLASRTV